MWTMILSCMNYGTLCLLNISEFHVWICSYCCMAVFAQIGLTLACYEFFKHDFNINHNRNWNILSWNIRGLNASEKWLALHQKIEESAGAIVSLQETKREHFDLPYIRNFCPHRFSKFAAVPSVGAFGGLLVAWNGSLFDGEVLFQNKFSISIQFTSLMSNQSWILTNIYGPCEHVEKVEFINWFSGIHMPTDIYWIIMGDFNFIRDSFNSNRPGGMLMKCFFSMKPLATWGWLNFH